MARAGARSGLARTVLAVLAWLAVLPCSAVRTCRSDLRGSLPRQAHAGAGECQRDEKPGRAGMVIAYAIPRVPAG